MNFIKLNSQLSNDVLDITSNYLNSILDFSIGNANSAIRWFNIPYFNRFADWLFGKNGKTTKELVYGFVCQTLTEVAEAGMLLVKSAIDKLPSNSYIKIKEPIKIIRDENGYSVSLVLEVTI